MVVVITKSDQRDENEEYEVELARSWLAVTLIVAEMLGARVVDLDHGRNPAMVLWSQTELLELPTDLVFLPHLVIIFLKFAPNGFADLDTSVQATSGVASDYFVVQHQEGETRWTFWHDGYRRLQFIRDMPMGPIEKLVAWGSKGERCCNVTVLKEEIESWAIALNKAQGASR